jgi:flavin-dependent dehydrogenase
VEGRLIPHRYLIGADGQASRVRSWAGLEAGSLRSQRLGFRRHYRFPANGLPLGGYVEVHWGPRGQAYLTPVGENEICIAAVTRQGGLNFDSIVDDLPHLKQALQGAQAIGRDRGAVTTTRKLRHVVRGNIALIGDASGSADAVTGEGLASAFREAHLLGEALGRDRIGDYEAGQSRILRLPQGMASVMLSMDRWPAWRNRAMRVLAGSPELFAAMLAVHIGENGAMNFAASHSWELLYRLIFPKSDAASRLPASHRTANDPNLSPHDTGLAYRQR